VQERLQIPARERRRWLKILLWTVLSLSIPFPAGTPDAVQGVAGDTERLPAALRQLAQIDDLIASEALKAFKLGVDSYSSEHYSDALAALPDDQKAKATDIADYVLLYRAKSNLMMDRDQEALESFRLLEKQFPDSSLLQDALRGQCQALLKLHEPGSILSILKNPKIRKDSETLYYEARAFELTGENEKAIERYLSLYSQYPKSSFSGIAERNLLSLSPAVLKGRRNYDARLLRSENLLNANDASGARKLLRTLGQVAAPDAASSQKQRLLLAEAEYRLRRTSLALSLLRKVTSTDSALREKAVRLEGACYRRLDREKSFIAQRDKALKLYPHSPETEELCYSAATYFDVNYESSKAREAYKVLYEHFPKGEHAERALWKLALFDYFEKNYAEAARGFWSYLRAYSNPLAASSAMYWMGRCYTKLGGIKNAEYLFGRVQALANNSYFGQSARKSEASLDKSGDPKSVSIPGIDFEKVVAACEGIQFSVIHFEEPAKSVVPVIERARQLWAAGLPDLAVFELRWANRRYPRDEKSLTYIISRIYASKEDHYKAIANLRSLYPDYVGRPISMMPEEIWQLLFPVRHWSIISSQAAKTKLDPSLVLGIIRQESAFKENARSPANARGLMQILPSTGSRLARQARISRYSSQKLYKAETNIILGTHHLAYLLERYGETELALAAYNAGASRVNRWLTEFGNVDMPELIELIPFSETRGYIKQILSNQAVYGLLTSSAAPANP
jgi:soluble lytic murein transglycosylase